MSDRSFTREDIHALLKRAAELQMTDADEKIGLTLAEIEQIAADSGIPPKYVRDALYESDRGISVRDVAGQSKTHAFVERVVPGLLSDEDWEAIVRQLREEYHGRGTTEQLGHTREWEHTSSLGVVTTFSARQIDGNQHVSLRRSLGLASPRAEGIGYGLAIALTTALIVGGINESVWMLFVVLALVWAIAAPGIEFLDRRWRARILREMKTVVKEIDHRIREETPSTQTAGAPASRIAGDFGTQLDRQDSIADSQSGSARRRDRI